MVEPEVEEIQDLVPGSESVSGSGSGSGSRARSGECWSWISSGSMELKRPGGLHEEQGRVQYLTVVLVYDVDMVLGSGPAGLLGGRVEQRSRRVDPLVVGSFQVQASPPLIGPQL